MVTNDATILRLKHDVLYEVAKAAGAPSDKGAGVLLGKKLGMKVSEFKAEFARTSCNNEADSSKLDASVRN